MATQNHSGVPVGFKEIPGYAGKYFINEQGQVWSCFRNRILTQHLDAKKLYLTCLLTCPDKTKRPRLVHHLMGITWMDACPGEWGASRGKYQINHKDGNKRNNFADNLEWVKHEENLRHAWGNDLQSYGENRPNAQFTTDEVRVIRLRLLDGEKIKTIASDFNVNEQSIKRIQQYVAWKRQDWDLIKPMMQVCKSKWLPITLECVKNGGHFWDYSRPRVP